MIEILLTVLGEIALPGADGRGDVAPGTAE
jgi:hypothetical protein